MYTITFALSALLSVAQASPVSQALQPRASSNDKCIVEGWWHHQDTITPDLGSGSGPINKEADWYSLAVFKNGDMVYNKTAALNGVKSKDISAHDTKLSAPIHWKSKEIDGWEYCECSFGNAATNRSTDISAKGDTFLFTVNDDSVCSCGFDCGTDDAGGEKMLTTAASLAGVSVPTASS